MTLEVTHLAVCVDCLAFLANGPDDLPAERVEEIAAAVARQGGECFADCESDCDGGFSWSPCELCLSPLGGERHRAAVLTESINAE